MSRALSSAVLFALAAFHSAPATAIDGEVLLTQAKALAGNITPGDSPGYPIIISTPGSYKLAGNLSAPAGKTGIAVTSGAVTIDFAGFLLSGGDTATHGISGTADNLTIKDGTILNFARRGILGSGDFWTIDNMRIVSNLDGIYGTGRSWSILNSQIEQNARVGINVVSASSTNARIQDNSIVDNGIAIQVSSAHVEGNFIARNNPGVSIVSGTVLGNTLVYNGEHGLKALSTSVGYGNNSFAHNGDNQFGSQVTGGFPMHPNNCDGSVC